MEVGRLRQVIVVAVDGRRTGALDRVATIANMPPEALAALFLAGVLAGTVSVLVSLASLISYPALLAVGLPPVAANVTNTVALVFTGIGAGLGSQRELVGQRPVLVRLAVAGVVGGAIGAALLLVLPERAFELVAPLLIAGASVLLLVQPRLRSRQAARAALADREARAASLRPSTAAVYGATAVYTGYFGAAGGILAFVALSRIIDRPFHDVNAAKNLLAAVSNGAAAVMFVLLGPVHWLAVIPLAAGLFTGGLIGPTIARRVPAAVLRVVVALCGLGVAGMLAWNTYR